MNNQMYQKKKYGRNLDNEKHIKNRYNYYKNLIVDPAGENIIRFIRCKTRSFFDHSKACVTSSAVGYFLGLSVGGKWGGNGGWIAGGFTQLICLFVAPFFGLFHGALTGIIFGEADALYILRDYNYTVNSTMATESYKIPLTLVDTKNSASNWVKAGELTRSPVLNHNSNIISPVNFAKP